MANHFESTSLTALRKLPNPIVLGPRHVPIRQDVLVETQRKAFESLGLKVEHIALKIKNPTPSRIKDVEVAPGRENGVLIADFRFKEETLAKEFFLPNLEATPTAQLFHANDQTHPVTLSAMQYILVCTNGLMAWQQTALLSRKHTTHIDISQECADAAEEWSVRIFRLNKLAEQLATVKLTDEAAKVIIYDSFAQENPVAPVQYFPQVNAAYFQPENDWVDVTPRTLFSVQNAFSRVAREMNPIPRREVEAQATKFAEQVLAAQ